MTADATIADHDDEKEIGPLDAFLGPRAAHAEKTEALYDHMAEHSDWGDQFKKFSKHLQDNPDRAKDITAISGRDPSRQGFNLQGLKELLEHKPDSLEKINDLIESADFDAAAKSIAGNDALLQYFVKIERDDKYEKLGSMLDLFHHRSRENVKADFFKKLADFIDNRSGLLNSALEAYIGDDGVLPPEDEA